MSEPETPSRRFIGRYAVVDASTGTPLDEHGYVALLLTEGGVPGLFLGTAATLDALLAHLAVDDVAAKFKHCPLELDVPPEPYFDHGPRRLAHPSVLAWLERERVLTVLSGR